MRGQVLSRLHRLQWMITPSRPFTYGDSCTQLDNQRVDPKGSREKRAGCHHTFTDVWLMTEMISTMAIIPADASDSLATHDRLGCYGAAACSAVGTWANWRGKLCYEQAPLMIAIWPHADLTSYDCWCLLLFCPRSLIRSPSRQPTTSAPTLDFIMIFYGIIFLW